MTDPTKTPPPKAEKTAKALADLTAAFRSMTVAMVRLGAELHVLGLVMPEAPNKRSVRRTP